MLEVEEFTASNGKTIRWCQVDVGEDAPRGIICGARNFADGDLVVVALPGAVLPGGFAITARKTYGHVSDGMICSARELGLGDDHSGILVLPPELPRSAPTRSSCSHLRDVVLDLETTTDRGYEMSVRGIARELAHAFDAPYRDPAAEVDRGPAPDGARLAGPDRGPGRLRPLLGPRRHRPRPGRAVAAVDAPPAALSGIRSISLAVDVTNYVMLETGQPMHAFDRDRLTGPICRAPGAAGGDAGHPGRRRARARPGRPAGDRRVRADRAGRDHGRRRAPRSGRTTTDVVLEAAHWEPATISRGVRRHRLPSEAAKRFERGVDPQVAGPALAARLRRCWPSTAAPASTAA